jgi:hypothetical protein
MKQSGYQNQTYPGKIHISGLMQRIALQEGIKMHCQLIIFYLHDSVSWRFIAILSLHTGSIKGNLVI